MIIDYYGSDLYLVHVTLGLACIREVFSSRIYVADLRRDSIFAYFEKRGVTQKLMNYDGALQSRNSRL